VAQPKQQIVAQCSGENVWRVADIADTPADDGDRQLRDILAADRDPAAGWLDQPREELTSSQTADQVSIRIGVVAATKMAILRADSRASPSVARVSRSWYVDGRRKAKPLSRSRIIARNGAITSWWKSGENHSTISRRCAGLVRVSIGLV